MVLREYDIVRVAKLIEPARRFDGSEGVRRPPQIGDLAMIGHVYDPTALALSGILGVLGGSFPARAAACPPTIEALRSA